MAFTYELRIVPADEFYHIPGYTTSPLGCSTSEGTVTNYIVMEKKFGRPNPNQQSLLDIIKKDSIKKTNPKCDISITFK
jgi:hypothetical protein